MRLFCRCGRRKVWFVYTYGQTKSEGKLVKLNRVSRPFNKKSAADSYRNDWDDKYKGHAVVDYRLMTADELMFADTE